MRIGRNCLFQPAPRRGDRRPRAAGERRTTLRPCAASSWSMSRDSSSKSGTPGAARSDEKCGRATHPQRHTILMVPLNPRRLSAAGHALVELGRIQTDFGGVTL